MPTLPDESLTDLPEVELIERDVYQGDKETRPATPEPMSRAPIVGTKALAAVSAGLILVAFAIMTRPGPEDRVVPEQPQTTVPLPTTVAESATPTSTLESTLPPLQAIPPLESNLPDDLPGTISGFDDRGSALVISRDFRIPEEAEILMVPPIGEPTSHLGIGDGPILDFGREFEIRGSSVVIDDGVSFLGTTFDLKRVIADGPATVTLVEERGRELVVQRRVIVDDPENEIQELEWSLPTTGVDVVGLWNDEVLVHRANVFSLVDLAGNMRGVTDGELLSYDGQHLAVLTCQTAGRCSFEVGTPDAPQTHILSVPVEIERVPVERWASTVDVSPDGTALALSIPDGGLSLPIIVDLITGETTVLADGINHRSPVVWSPDGQWLGYLYTDDVMVWSLQAGRSWRVSVNRDLRTLLWE